MPSFIKNSQKTPVVVRGVDGSSSANTLLRGNQVTSVPSRDWIAFRRTEFAQHFIRNGTLTEVDEPPPPDDDNDNREAA